MAIPFLQKLLVGGYVPLYRCKLACGGCGKIDYPDEILDLRLSLQQCLEAVDECGAPVVSIAFFHFLRAHRASRSG